MADTDWNKLISGIKERANARKSSSIASLPISTTSIHLPCWPDSTRGVPNAVLRSALFGVISRGNRTYLEAVTKASVQGITLVHTGPKLDQADLDVWLQCLHLASKDGLGIKINFTANRFLKDIGRDTGKSQHEWLKSSVRRLMNSLVELTYGNRSTAVHLIQKWERDEDTNQHVLEMHPQILKMFDVDAWTQIDAVQRNSLKGQPLAQWLHGFYSTHAKPFPYGVELIHSLCGSQAKTLKDFKKGLRTSLTLLAKATGWNCEIRNDLVIVNKKVSGCQARHVARKNMEKIYGIAAPKLRHSALRSTA